ncbi:tripartite tricarboxylate transporter substrate binding protein [Variovorax sp. J22R115]|uniref:Bug family tripartite tricarboxylate transporter substrate binding protein n=1 Tax=Variovorax sp. J22R115 TaxID=3053509 RepID=UPI0025755526|nr:tripartite tricarboxylate transporter substrate-binding protein [Variovorax sp. J22R115]MDM0053841.1 tripartite tricarboxylate transporter substrate-binding protein [Variovorax sp. J22R115]
MTALSLGAVAALSFAQGYPSKPITIVVAYPAGGDTDVLARVLAEKLTTRLGRPVLVDNKPGASGVIGSSYVAKAAADGHTLLLAPSTFAMAQLVLKTSPKSGYDVLNDFTPIIETGTQPLFIAAGPGTAARTLKEALDASRTTELAFASPGSGSPMHVLGEMFNKATGANFHHVPYRGVAPALNDVAGGHVPLTWITYGPVAPYLADGKMRLLAVAQANRTPLAPEVPTLAELGYKGVEVSAWNGLYGPKGLSADIVKTLNTHLNEIIKMPDVAARMKALGILPLGGAPETLSKTTAADLESFSRVVKALGIQAD